MIINNFGRICDVKKLFGLMAVCLLALSVSGYAGTGKMLRWAGTSTTSQGYLMAVDSADRIETDTVLSDVATISDYPNAKILIITPIKDTTIACDSCVAAWDSTKINIWTRDLNGFSKIIASTKFTSDHTRDTATTLRFYITSPVVTAAAKDSTVFDQVWIQTIMIDSVRTGMIAKDTTIYKGGYYLWFVE
jgi:hypothetical protein